MKLKTLHSWPRSVSAAIALQRRLAPGVRCKALPANPERFAGVDVAFSSDGRTAIAGIVVLELDSAAEGSFRVVEEVVSRAPCRFPYVPGLLTFRELPAVLRAFRRLDSIPNLIFADAQGIAHPRRLGLASHLGLWLDLPTIGCAKTRLCGEHHEPGFHRGQQAPLVHQGEEVGVVLRTKNGVRPLYVSVGHLCTLQDATRWTLALASRYRLPEPARRAHQLVTRARTRPRA